MKTKNNPVIIFAKELAGNIELNINMETSSDDRYRFKYKNKIISIHAGSERGVLYAVYDVLAGMSENNVCPHFSIRGINPCESLARHSAEQLRSLIDRMGRWRMNTIIIHSEYGYRMHKKLIDEECRKRGIEITYYIYSNLAFMNKIPFEYYAKDINNRPCSSRLECETRLCINNNKGLDLYTEGVKKYLREHPGQKRMLFATADGYGLCQCPSCRFKDAIEQWEPIFNNFFDNADDRIKEMIVYVQRFSVPKDTVRINSLDRIMFDTHLRYPRVPLGTAHSCNTANIYESTVDYRAKNTPINIYLHDRLREWRDAYNGKLYIFENLMIQGTMSCPWPNTQVYLKDIENFKSLGIDGIVYECFEPGIEYFKDTFDHIAAKMWNVDLSYKPDSFEQVYITEGGDDPEVKHIWPGHPFWSEYLDCYPQMELARKLYKIRFNPTESDFRNAVEYIFVLRERYNIDWLFIGFYILKQINNKHPIKPQNELEEKFLRTPKLWDFMETLSKPQKETETLIENIGRKYI